MHCRAEVPHSMWERQQEPEGHYNHCNAVPLSVQGKDLCVLACLLHHPPLHSWTVSANVPEGPESFLETWNDIKPVFQKKRKEGGKN